MGNDGKVSNTETINQNIYSGKLINLYSKQFETLLMKQIDENNSVPTVAKQYNNNDRRNNNNFSQPPRMTKSQPVAANRSVANIRLLYEDPDASSKYHRPKEDLRSLENTLSNLESYLDMNPEVSLDNSTNSPSNISFCNITNCPSDGDTLSDFDLEKFNTNSGKPINDGSKVVNSAGVTFDDPRKVWGVGAIVECEQDDTTSLSEFHNVRDVLMNIRERLETLLKGNEKSDEENNDSNQKEKRSRNAVGSDKSNLLELNISHLKHDLDRYVEILNEKKENELRKFSENMSNQQKIVQMKKAFKRKERFSKHIYETLTPATTCKPYRQPCELPCHNNMSANSTHVMDEFTMRRCFNETDSCCDCSEMQSVEYYSMLINEDVGEKSLHGAPHSFHNREREKISLVNFRDPINVIRQWQDYQIKTIRGQKSKSSKARFKLRWQRELKRKPPVYGFTLDYHQSKLLQQKIDKERKIRLFCRLIFYFFSIVCFVLVVVIVQSVFNFNKRKIDVKW